MDDSASPSKRKCYEHDTRNSEVTKNLFSEYAKVYNPNISSNSQMTNYKHECGNLESTRSLFSEYPNIYNSSNASCSSQGTNHGSDVNEQNNAQHLWTSYWHTYNQLYGNLSHQCIPNSSVGSSSLIIPNYAITTANGNNKTVPSCNKINAESTMTIQAVGSNNKLSITSDTGRSIKTVEPKHSDLSEKIITYQALPSSHSVTGLPVTSIGGKFLSIELELAQELQSLQFTSPVSHIYNPLEYAVDVHGMFLKKYCSGFKQVLFLGMNPGPYGMVQTGVPFGEIKHVRDWLQICGEIKKPMTEHPKRPILGFGCKRSEVSGARFWGYFQSRCQIPEQFFKDCFVYNMCPLVFMNQNGKNLTPPDLNLNTRNRLNEICDKYLCKIVELLKVKIVIGVGNFAQKRAMKALKGFDLDVKVIMHPSPANPAANKGWNAIVEKQLEDIGVSKFL